MFKLSKEKYGDVKELIKTIEVDLVYTESILQEYQSGSIYVDRIVRPETAIFIHEYGFIYYAGNYNEQLLIELSSIVMGKNTQFQKRYALQLGNNEEFEKFFQNIAGIKRAEQYQFRYTREKISNNQVFDMNNGLENGLIVREINALNYNKLCGRIIPSHSFTSIDEFLKSGFGFCIFNKDEFVSTAFTSAVSNNYIDIGIETAPEYQKKGYGKLLAGLMVDKILESGKIPVWQCNVANIGSRSTAEAVGFEVVKSHPLFCKA